MNGTRSRYEQKFTLLELLIVVALVGIVTSVAMPVLLDGPMRAAAAALLSDAETVFKAATHYRLENGQYPRSRPWGVRPREFDDRLEGMSFVRGDLRYRWRRQGTRHGFMIRTAGDQALLDRVRAQWSGASVRWRDRLYLYEVH